MTPDNAGPQHPVETPAAVAGETADAVRSMVADEAAGLDAATATLAEGAESATREAAATASRATADAFGMARERLNAMADSLPGQAPELLRPFRSGGAALGQGMESGYATAIEGMAEFNSKAIAAWRSNAESTIQHWQSLVAVKSLSEAIALSAAHTRKQLEAMTSQTRELSALATRIVRDAADPLKLKRP